MIMIIDHIKKTHWLYLLVAVVFSAVACNEKKEPDATPQLEEIVWIQGGGSNTTGGRSGTVIYVTSLEDDVNQPGTLRNALAQTTARTILFAVAGRIDLKSELTIRRGNVSVFGESAPGDGICISGYPVVIDADNVILRFLRFRMGDEKKVEGDALTCIGHKNIVIDHCSFSWSTDECVSCYGNTDFTMQYCIVSESLRNSVHVKGNHGYGGIWGGTNASFHHNLLAHHDSRNPRFDHSYVNNTCFGPVDYVNNVVYNWGGNSTYGGEGYTQVRKINMVNNYYKYGHSTDSNKRNRLVDPTVSCSYCSDGHTLIPGKFWLEGNFMFNDPNVTADNWKGSTQNGSNVKASARWTEGLTRLNNEQTAEQAYETVLAKAGCSLHRDVVDDRIVSEVRNGTGKLIDGQSEVGGWPDYSGEKELDSDYDGIPDAWEKAHGLDPYTYSDSGKQTLVAGYTNLEAYLNSLVQDLF